MQLHINGQPLQLPEPVTAGELLERLELLGRRVAVEVNGEIVPRSRHAEYRFKEGDKVEIIHAVGGG